MSEFGSPEVLKPADVPEPEAGPGEALIEVEFVNVMFVETQIRAGRAPRKEMLPELPTIPGNPGTPLAKLVTFVPPLPVPGFPIDSFLDRRSGWGYGQASLAAGETRWGSTACPGIRRPWGSRLTRAARRLL